MTPKRHPVRKYDKRFKARGKGRSYTFTGVPASLANAVRDKAKRNGDSVRSLVLEALAAYAEWTPATADEEPEQGPTTGCPQCDDPHVTGLCGPCQEANRAN